MMGTLRAARTRSGLGALPSAEMTSAQLASWLVAFAVGGSVAVIALLARRAVLRWRETTPHTLTVIDDIIVHALRRTKWPVLVLFSMLAGLQFAPVGADARRVCATALTCLVVIQSALWLDRGLTEAVLKARSLKDQNAEAFTAVTTLSFIGKVIVWTLVLMFVLDNLGVDITALVTGLGIGGVAVALALQSVLQDLLASIAIVFDKPFVVGDYVVVGQEAGTVEHVGIKTTRVRSKGGELIIFSNSDLLSSRIRNFGRMLQRRGEITVHVPLETPPDLLEAIPHALRAIVEVDLDADVDEVFLRDRLESTFVFELTYFMKASDLLSFRTTHERLNIAIHRWLADHHIEPGYPTTNFRVWEARAKPPADA